MEKPGSPTTPPPPSPADLVDTIEAKDGLIRSTQRLPASAISHQQIQGLPQPAATQLRQNHVSTTTLHGIPIVCLWIDGQERLCLAQISNTLLKSFSYNEIHNRRVALGITCVQCTPVQLEILRRAGAMPISSRRCGMITKREAERLVKSFLEENAPPRLPENFAFDVSHSCGWGCKGHFMPSRYNSSRAKCIKCTYCNIFLSPNKFIFHFHRTPDAKYRHPDAANFNSWRRHLSLETRQPSDELIHVWEDVKAMFNGGSRKRLLCNNPKTPRNMPEMCKQQRLSQNNTDMTSVSSSSPPISSPLPVTSPPFPSLFPYTPYPTFPIFPEHNIVETQKFSWTDIYKNKNSNYCGPLNFLWAKNLAMYSDPNNPYYNIFDRSRQTYANGSLGIKQVRERLDAVEPPAESPEATVRKHYSAFRPVGQHGRTSPITSCDSPKNQHWRPMSSSPDIIPDDSLPENDVNITDVVGEQDEEQVTSSDKSLPPLMPNTQAKELDLTVHKMSKEMEDSNSSVEVDDDEGTEENKNSIDPTTVYSMSKEELQSALLKLIDRQDTTDEDYFNCKDQLVSQQNAALHLSLSKQLQLIKESAKESV